MSKMKLFLLIFVSFLVSSSRGTVFVSDDDLFQFPSKREYRIADKTCLLVPNVGPCRGDITMWFYDPEIQNCTTFHWGGCQGNGNRFDSFTECRTTCLTKKPVGRPRFCKLSYDYGYCFGAETRYYYDHRWKVCKSALYSGCGGNKNKFRSLEMCEHICRFGKELVKMTKDGSNKKLIVNPNDLINKTKTARKAIPSTVYRFIHITSPDAS